MSIRAGVIIAVAFEKVDAAPDTQTGSEGDDEGLKNLYCAVEEIHNNFAGEQTRRKPQTTKTCSPTLLSKIIS